MDILPPVAKKLKRGRRTMDAHICEYHNEVLQILHRSIASRKLNFSGLKLLHLDSHPDMCYPLEEKADSCFNPQVVYDAVDIAEWILPLVYCGHISSLIWLKPTWSDQIEDGTYVGCIGRNKDGFLRVSINCNYFVEERLYEDEKNLRDAKKFELVVVTFDETRKTDRADSSSCVDLTHRLKEHIQENDELILDIDMDHFSTRNPFRSLFTESEIRVLRNCYKFTPPKDETFTTIKDAMDVYEKQLLSLNAKIKSYVQRLKDGDDSICISRPDATAELESESDLGCLLKELYKKWRHSDEMFSNFEMVHIAGQCAELPHHISTESEICENVELLERVLKALPVPKVITLARSSTDDFTPPDQVDFIQELLLQSLTRCYPDLIINHHYANEDD